MATYLIDYENPAGQKFFDFADGYRFPNCHRITDFVKERYRRLSPGSASILGTKRHPSTGSGRFDYWLSPSNLL